MKKILLSIMGAVAMYGANAADITIYYSPTCPHCHHARDFFENTVVYEYDTIKINEVNVTNRDNRQAFVDALFKCGYNKGGVPVMVIGEKCFQGYSDDMQADLRAAVEVDLTDEQKQAAVANRTEMESDKAAFVEAHVERKDAISDADNQKKNEE